MAQQPDHALRHPRRWVTGAAAAGTRPTDATVRQWGAVIAELPPSLAQEWASDMFEEFVRERARRDYKQ